MSKNRKNSKPAPAQPDLVNALCEVLSNRHDKKRGRTVTPLLVYLDAYGWYRIEDAENRKDLRCRIKLEVKEYSLTGNIPEIVSEFCARQLRYYSGKGAIYTSNNGRKA